MSSVGTIKVDFSGDTTALEAAQARAVKALGGVDKAATTTRAKLATPFDPAPLDGLARSASGVADALGGRLGPAANAAHNSMDRLRDVAGKVDQGAGKLQTVIGGLSQALGLSAGAIGNAVGGVADLGSAIGTGGPLMAAAAVAGVGLVALRGYFDDIAKHAADAKRAAVDSVAAIATSAAKRQSDADIRLTKGLTGITDDDVARLAVARAEAAGLEMELKASNALAEPGWLTRKLGLEPQAITDARTKLTALRAEIQTISVAVARAKSTEAWSVPAAAPTAAEKIAHASVIHADAQERAARAMSEQWNPADAARFESAMREGHVAQADTDRAELDAAVRAQQAQTLADSFDGFNESVTKATAEHARAAEADLRDRLGEIDKRRQAIEANDEAMRVEAQSRRAAQQQANADAARGIASAVVGGSGFATLGGMAGGVAGAAVAPFVGVDPMTGGAVGEVLGNLFGGLIDKLGPVQDIISTLMGGLGDLVGGLAPYFEAMKPEAKAIADIFSALAPLLTELVSPFTALVGVFAVVAVESVPLIEGFVSLSVWLLRTIGVVRPLVVLFDSVAQSLNNWLGGSGASVVGGPNHVGNGAGGGRDDGHVGGTYQGNSEQAKAINDANAAADAASQQALTDFLTGNTGALDDNTNALREFNQSLTNIPSGYRIPFYESEAANGKGGVDSVTDGLRTGSPTTFQGCTFHIVAASPAIADEIRKQTMASRGKPMHLPRGNNPGRNN